MAVKNKKPEGLFIFGLSVYNQGMLTDSQRKQKKIIIAAIFFVILGGLVFSFYYSINPPLPPATPNPTAHLLPIQVLFSKLLNVENNDYDFVAKVYNPNTEYGSPEVEYELNFIGFNNNQINKQTGRFHILPGQTRHIIFTPIALNEPANSVEMNILNIDWQKLDPLAGDEIPLVVSNAPFSSGDRVGVLGKVSGEIVNGSDFDLNQVEVIVLLYGENNKLLNIGQTEIRTFLSKTKRAFEVFWYRPIVDKIVRTEIEVHTNALENMNFLRRYEKPEKFQQLY